MRMQWVCLPKIGDLELWLWPLILKVKFKKKSSIISGSLIAPMALAHPLHPIDNRSRNRRRNLWVGWCVSSWWPLFPSSSVLINICIYIYALLYEFCFLWFTNCVLLSNDDSITSECVWLLAFVQNNTLMLGIWCSTFPHLPLFSVPGHYFVISESTWYHRTPSCHI